MGVGCALLLSARYGRPVRGQTKEKLNNRDASTGRCHGARPAENWLNAHVEDARKIAELAIRQAQNRLRSNQ